MLKIQCLTVDCKDPAVLADFWSKALSWKIGDGGNDREIWIEKILGDSESSDYPDILFLKNSDSKLQKNRLHLDLRPKDQSAEVARLESLGASRIEVGQGNEPQCTWIVMADPEGNEFCVLKPRIN